MPRPPISTTHFTGPLAGLCHLGPSLACLLACPHWPACSVRGHLRTNAAGANLNREWENPQPDYAPEVLCVLRKMDETGCDAFFDVHGDEEVSLALHPAVLTPASLLFVQRLGAAGTACSDRWGYGAGCWRGPVMTRALHDSLQLVVCCSPKI